MDDQERAREVAEAGTQPTDSQTLPASTKRWIVKFVLAAVAVLLLVAIANLLKLFGTRVTRHTLAGMWECHGRGRPVYEFDAAGTYTVSALGDPNSADPALRASTQVKGTFGVSSGRLTMTQTRVLVAAEPQDLPTFLGLSMSGAVRRVGANTFEISPGRGYNTMNATISDKSLTLHVTGRVNAKGQVVNPPSGGWQPFTCSKG